MPDLGYLHWTGRHATLPNPDRWMELGIAPVPSGRWATWRYHWHHGRLMGFPVLSVLAFCVRSTRGYHWWNDNTHAECS